MPRVWLEIDHTMNMIDTPNLDLLGVWFAEVIGRYPIEDSTYVNLRVTPLYLPNPADPRNGALYVPDYNVDTRYLDKYAATMKRGRAGAVRALIQQLEAVAEGFDQVDGTGESLPPVEPDPEVVDEEGTYYCHQCSEAVNVASSHYHCPVCGKSCSMMGHPGCVAETTSV